MWHKQERRIEELERKLALHCAIGMVQSDDGGHLQAQVNMLWVILACDGLKKKGLLDGDLSVNRGRSEIFLELAKDRGVEPQKTDAVMQWGLHALTKE